MSVLLPSAPATPIAPEVRKKNMLKTDNIKKTNKKHIID